MKLFFDENNDIFTFWKKIIKHIETLKNFPYEKILKILNQFWGDNYEEINIFNPEKIYPLLKKNPIKIHKILDLLTSK